MNPARTVVVGTTAAVLALGVTEAASGAAARGEPCSRAEAPTRSASWRAYVPVATPVRRRPTQPNGGLPRTSRGAWHLVLGSRRTPGGCLVEVRLAGRPNDASGWIAASRVRLARTPWRIEVDRARRRATLLRAGRATARWRVVVGKAATPTPAGLFAIEASYRTPRSSFEGAWIVALTAHSEALSRYRGGDGQAALHGRGGRALRDPLGTAASHGCIRFDNRAIGTIVRRVGRGRLPGVPVVVR